MIATTLEATHNVMLALTAGVYRGTVTAEVYDAFLCEAMRLFPDAPCAVLDPEAFEVFSNVYKSNTGLRPRGKWTVEEVQRYMGWRDD